MKKKLSQKSEGFWERWRTELTPETFSAFQAAQNRSLPKVIRVNSLRNSIEEFLEWSAKNHPDWHFTPHPFGEGIFLIDRQDRSVPLGHSFGHATGRFYIQEASSCLPALALRPLQGERVLDMTAAPGSKSTQIAALMQGDGLLVTNEIAASRIKKLVFNLIRCGVPNAVVTDIDGKRWGDLAPGFFDRVLLDAPCTGEGTYRKKHSVLDYWSTAKIEEITVLQEQLLLSAFRALRPNGLLIYSTCTLAPEENERVISRFLKAHSAEAELCDLTSLFTGAEKARGLSEFAGEDYAGLNQSLRIWPQLFDSEGFFVAAIRKTSGEEQGNRRPKKSFRSRSDSLLPPTEQEAVESYLHESFGFAIPVGFTIIKRIGEKERVDYWLIPEDGVRLLENVSLQRPGIRLLERHGKKFQLEHDAAVVFGKRFKGKNVIELTPAQAKRYLAKLDLPLPEDFSASTGQFLLKYQGIPLGTAKIVSNRLKNSLPPAFAGQYL